MRVRVCVLRVWVGALAALALFLPPALGAKSVDI